MVQETISQIPDFKISKEEIPIIKIKTISFENFKVFDNCSFDFKDKQFVCLVGPNGCGKTTILDSVQILFSRYEGYDQQRLRALLGKSVRHVDGKKDAMFTDKDDFLITAQIQCSTGDYELQLTKNGFTKDHPEEIKWIVYRLCFYASFDQELHQFQLPRDKWQEFQTLFTSVTGFPIEENTTLFTSNTKLLDKYVLGFNIHKPNEIICHKECSAGERKIIKSFSTLLTKEYTPQIILVDNIEMHVEIARHIDLVNSMIKCFPNSQIFSSTHSYQISRYFPNRSQIYDLRLVKANNIVKNNPWRLFIADEIQDNLSKLRTINDLDCVKRKIKQGEELLTGCLNSIDNFEVLNKYNNFMKNLGSFFTDDIMFKYNINK